MIQGRDDWQELFAADVTLISEGETTPWMNFADNEIHHLGLQVPDETVFAMLYFSDIRGTPSISIRDSGGLTCGQHSSKADMRCKSRARDRRSDKALLRQTDKDGQRDLEWP